MSAATALVLFAHGARDPRWAEPFEAIAQAVRNLRPQTDVRLAYLEFMSPNLLEAAAEAARSGATTISVVPLFLGAGGHVRKDLPHLMQTLREQHPAVAFHLEPAIGERTAVIQAMAQAVAQGSGTPADGQRTGTAA